MTDIGWIRAVKKVNNDGLWFLGEISGERQNNRVAIGK